jgi:hypothetical protein
MAKFNAEALKFPFDGLHIVFCGNFCQLKLIGVQFIYNRDLNALWNMSNRVMILNLNSHHFIYDPQFFFCWKD